MTKDEVVCDVNHLICVICHTQQHLLGSLSVLVTSLVTLSRIPDRRCSAGVHTTGTVEAVTDATHNTNWYHSVNIHMTDIYCAGCCMAVESCQKSWTCTTVLYAILTCGSSGSKHISSVSF